MQSDEVTVVEPQKDVASLNTADESEVVPAVQVCVRVRPVLPWELAEGHKSTALTLRHGDSAGSRAKVILTPTEGKYEEDVADRDCRRARRTQEFGFNAVFGPESSQQEVWENLHLDLLLDKVLQGYHATLFAYGQTGSGKTYTMEGYAYGQSRSAAQGGSSGPRVRLQETPADQLGIVPRALKDLFAKVDAFGSNSEDEHLCVKISFLQIYQEKVFDLLNSASDLPGSSRSEDMSKPQDLGLRLRWDAAKQRFFVENLFEYECSSFDDAIGYYAAGVQRKNMASTTMNSASSRSHSMLVMTLKRNSPIRSGLETTGAGPAVQEVVSSLSLVDLAGSERAATTSDGQAERFKEAVNINQSLFALRRVITALSRRDTRHEDAEQHIPYRDSKLTSLLQHAIGGKGFMVMMACLSPADSYFEENLSTLQYATEAAMIKNDPVVNLDPKDQLIQDLRQQLQAAHAFILKSLELQQLPEELVNIAQQVAMRRTSGSKPRSLSRKQSQASLRQQQRDPSVDRVSPRPTVSSSRSESVDKPARAESRPRHRSPKRSQRPPEHGSQATSAISTHYASEEKHEKKQRLPPIPSQANRTVADNQKVPLEVSMARLATEHRQAMKLNRAFSSDRLPDSGFGCSKGLSSRSASASDLPGTCPKEGHQGAPEVGKGLTKTSSWDAKREQQSRVDLEAQLKAAEAQTRELEEMLKEASKNKRPKDVT